MSYGKAVELRRQGKTHAEVCEELNRLGYRTRRENRGDTRSRSPQYEDEDRHACGPIHSEKRDGGNWQRKCEDSKGKKPAQVIPRRFSILGRQSVVVGTRDHSITHRVTPQSP